jgi:membrane protease YdiL (CAAX protease family)
MKQDFTVKQGAPDASFCRAYPEIEVEIAASDEMVDLTAVLPVAVILSVARHFGESVLASTALHILYNFIIFISPAVMNAVGLL